MGTKTEADEFSYAVPAWRWEQHPASVIRDAIAAARRKRRPVVGEPQVRVLLVWPRHDDSEQLPLEHC